MCVIKRVTADDAVQIYTTAIQPSSGKRANLNTEAHCQRERDYNASLPVLRAALWLLRLS